MASPSLIDKPRRPRIAKPRRRSKLRRRDAESLDADTLKAIQFSVSELLRREYGQSPAFAVDTAGEMVNQAYMEYAEKPETEQEQVRNLPGLLVTTAVRRSIDKARREGREVRGEGAQAIIDNAQDQAPSTEMLAARGIEAVEVFEAVAELHHEQRRALALLYWEELSTREAAERMGVGTMTVCRRRDDAMDRLRARFGVEPDDRQVGYSAWTILVVKPAAIHGASSAAGQLAASADTARHGLDTLWRGLSDLAGRAKEQLAARISGSGGSEPIGGAISSGSAGGLAKTLGACATAGVAIYCGAGAVGVGPGLGIIDLGGSKPAPPAAVRQHVAPAPPAAGHRKPLAPSRSGSTGDRKRQHASRRSEQDAFTRHRDRRGQPYTKAGEQAARGQSLGSQAPEPAPEPSPESVPEREPTYVGEPEGGGSSAASSAAAKQFGLP